MISLYWLAAFVILVGLEAMTAALTTIWFAGGAVAGFLLSLFGFSVELQLAVFLAVSFVLLLLTRPLVGRFVNRRTVRTNVDSLIGEKARVISEIDNAKDTGSAVTGGQEWTARALHDGEVFAPGTPVVIREIRGVRLIVERVEKQ